MASIDRIAAGTPADLEQLLQEFQGPIQSDHGGLLKIAASCSRMR
jgi:hypothetical protein